MVDARTELEEFFRIELAKMDADLLAGLPLHLAAERIDSDLWAMLHVADLTLYPGIQDRIPTMPEPAMQQTWVSVSGLDAMLEAAEFLRIVRQMQSRFMPHTPIGETRVLDFGCGWGRITRLLSKDWPATKIFGCDPSEDAIGVCKNSGVIGTFAVSDSANRALVFEEPFDIVLAFSIFTHFSEPLHRTTLETLARSIPSGGMLIATIRPRFSLRTRPGWPRSPELSEMELASMLARYDGGQYVFEPLSLPVEGADWGNSWIPCAYIEREWRRWFEPVAYSLLPAHRQQFVVSLRRH